MYSTNVFKLKSKFLDWSWKYFKWISDLYVQNNAINGSKTKNLIKTLTNQQNTKLSIKRRDGKKPGVTANKEGATCCRAIPSCTLYKEECKFLIQSKIYCNIVVIATFQILYKWIYYEWC